MRVNFFGGPSSGKSTTAAWLFAELKLQGHSIELVTEYVKAWTYLKRQVGQFDQIYLFGKQLQYENRFLEDGGVQHVVTDSPLFLSYCYALKYEGHRLADPIRELEEIYSETHEDINIFLQRGDKRYDTAGRYQSEEEARELDTVILEELEKHKNFVQLNYLDRASILEYVFSQFDL